MKKILVVIFILLFVYAKSQPGIAFTKTGDTIYFDNLVENKSSYDLYKREQEKKQRIKFEEISNVIRSPEFKIELNKIDEFTGERNIRTNRIGIGSNVTKSGLSKANLYIRATKIIAEDSLIYALIFRSPIELGCAGAKDNYVSIKFTDETLLIFDEDIANIDCERAAESIYMLTKDDMNIIKAHELKAVRLRKSKYSEDYYTLFPNCLSDLLKFIDSQ